ncbi:MAG TPA: PaaI family thioesterase, partial [Acidimicrobiia bacterium]|nr:PaaI family thioesterase [Acidimicrobiia bacterium]
MRMDPETHFSLELGFTHAFEEDSGRGHGTIAPELCVPGTAFPHAAVLLTFADSATGMLAGLATAPQVAVTVDFRLRIVRQPPFGPFESETRILRTGRTLTVGETVFVTAGDPAPFAVALGTFVASPRPADEQPGHVEAARSRPQRPILSVPFTERVALEILEPGVGEVVLREDLTNSTGTIQGGVLAILGEMAAHTLASAGSDRTFVVDDLDIRYLRAARVGPARSGARLLSVDGDRATAEVEMRDTGM